MVRRRNIDSARKVSPSVRSALRSTRGGKTQQALAGNGWSGFKSSASPGWRRFAVSTLTVVAMSTSKVDCRLGNGKIAEGRSARQSKSWPTRCRFWIERQGTGTVRRLLNPRSLWSLSTKATIPSANREARRGIKKSRFRAVPWQCPHFTSCRMRRSSVWTDWDESSASTSPSGKSRPQGAGSAQADCSRIALTWPKGWQWGRRSEPSRRRPSCQSPTSPSRRNPGPSGGRRPPRRLSNSPGLPTL